MYPYPVGCNQQPKAVPDSDDGVHAMRCNAIVHLVSSSKINTVIKQQPRSRHQTVGLVLNGSLTIMMTPKPHPQVAGTHDLLSVRLSAQT